MVCSGMIWGSSRPPVQRVNPTSSTKGKDSPINQSHSKPGHSLIPSDTNVCAMLRQSGSPIDCYWSQLGNLAGGEGEFTRSLESSLHLRPSALWFSSWCIFIIVLTAAWNPNLSIPFNTYWWLHVEGPTWWSSPTMLLSRRWWRRG